MPGDWRRSVLSPPAWLFCPGAGQVRLTGSSIGIAALAVSRISNACAGPLAKASTHRLVVSVRSPTLVSHRVACIAVSTGEQHRENKKPLWFLVPVLRHDTHCWVRNQGRRGLDVHSCRAATLDRFDCASVLHDVQTPQGLWGVAHILRHVVSCAHRLDAGSAPIRLSSCRRQWAGLTLCHVAWVHAHGPITVWASPVSISG